ncbi:YebC/PmpR family DNA-binding transcriptional regulator [Synechococcus sp. ATX 2A4]|uniref:YebC/PmpR family DNA-binding transcriptional regulator n=1 Tax=Synechococcus sp. ATX 2A4 TaxID=2823727 RepID=UPI0020CDD4C6|nr:YebC/PmpR family DNA-binding transcriptional regulator [Synechococcus sp. ATX 2A4]MCP9884309.1 YebC/PmpR family DNA-binding transcriptional regulator [Synechococcus sp. ATX 2A4]
MAGHSKWSQIKRQKAVVDAKRGVVFTRLAREISVAARAGADPAGNFQLRTALEKARAAGLPNNNIERAIAKGSGQGSGDGDQFQEVRYEGYGPGGVAVLVEALTDNRNRTAADLRLAFSKHGGNLGEVGSVGYLFEHRGVVRIEQPQLKENALLESLLAVELAGGPAALTYTFEPAATGVAAAGKGGAAAAGGRGGVGAAAEEEGASAEVVCSFADLEALQDALRHQGWSVQGWEHRWIPATTCRLEECEALRHCLRMLDALDDLDDVRSVTTNLEADEALIEALLA